MPEGFKIADAYADATIDLDRLNASIKEADALLATIRDRLIGLGIDQEPLKNDIAEVQAMLYRLTRRADIQVNMEAKEADELMMKMIGRVHYLQRQIEQQPDITDPEDVQRLADMDALLERMGAALVDMRKIDLVIQPKEAFAAYSALTAQVEILRQQMKDIDFTYNVKGIEEALGVLATRAGMLRRQIDITPRLSVGEMQESLKEIETAIAKVARKWNVEIDLTDLHQLFADLRGIGGQIELMQEKLKDFAEMADVSGLRAAGGWSKWAHWIIAGGLELAAVVIPAAIALGDAALVAVEGYQRVYQHAAALYTATEATNNMFHETVGQAIGLGSALQRAQTAADPLVYEAVGAALRLAAQHAGRMASIGLEVNQVWAQFLAHVEYSSAQGGMQQLQKLFHAMVPDLIMIAQILGNVGHAIVNIGAAAPGLAERLLEILRAASGLLLWVTNMPKPLLYLIILFEEIYRWGGGLVTVLARLSSGLGAIGTLGIPIFEKFGTIVKSAMAFFPYLLANISLRLASTVGQFRLLGGASTEASKTLAGFGQSLAGIGETMQGPWGLAVAAGIVAIGLLVWWFVRLRTATEQWIDSTNRAVQAATSLQALSVISSKLADTQLRLGQAAQTASSWQDKVNESARAGSRATGFLQAGVNAARTAESELAQEHIHLVGAMANVVDGAGHLVQFYHTTFIGALALATQAGVRLQNGILGQSQAAQIARFQIANLVHGYQLMGQPANQVGRDMTALAIQSGLAATQISKLNSAWDDLMNNVTGGTNAFSQFVVAIHGLGSSAASTSSSLTGQVGSINSTTGATARLRASLQGLGQNAQQTWQQFNSAITGPGQQMIDWLRTAGAEGVLTGQNLDTAIRSIISQFLPLAAHSRVAVAELSAMAQQAQGPTTDSFQVLKRWVDSGGHSMKDLQKIIDQTTIGMSNMSKVASNLGNVLQTQIVNTMDAARLSSSGLSGAITQLTEYINKNGDAGVTQTKVYQNALAILTRLTGSQKAATQILKTYTGQVNAGNVAEQTAYDRTHALKEMTDEFHAAIKAGQGTRQLLIDNLIATGLRAHLSTGQIATLISRIKGIPKSWTTILTEIGRGNFSIKQLSQASLGMESGTGVTRGVRGLVPGGYKYQRGGRIPGYGGGDRHLILTEAGEAVVPKEVVPYVAHILSAHGVPGFQAGGFVQQGNMGVATGAAGPQFWSTFHTSVTDAMKSAMTAAMTSAMAQAQAMMFQAGASAYGGSAAAMRFAQGLLGSYGWGGQWPALYNLWMRESGWNPYAVNPTSGAYGIPQSLGHGHPYNLGDYANQIRWGLAYIQSVYGSPNAAWAHEEAFNWYAQGTTGAPPGWGMVGERGPELVHFLGGEIVLPHRPLRVAEIVGAGPWRRARKMAAALHTSGMPPTAAGFSGLRSAGGGPSFKGFGTGGTIPVGAHGIVGEMGAAELVTATPGGAIVTPIGKGGGGPTIINQYYGTQYPTPEQQRRMNIEMSLALGIAP